ncbi:glycosyltransferase [Aquaspirillum sp. LM1]|uniref:glycosyltransferase n=1 Tax=Aquaspirillum sp. LM1 TaxID=1938604 RepID=UPI00098767BE|nr:glycosyltransferase [Aquaspirillum sp. LM1]
MTTALGTGGAEMALFRVLNALRPKGVQPLVVSIMALQGEHFPEMGIEIRSLDMPRARLNWQAVSRLRAIVKEFQPDIVQGWMYHSNVLAHLARYFAASQRHIPLAIAIRSSMTIFAQEKRLTRLVVHLDAWLSRWADRIFYVSRLGAQQHTNFGYSSQQAMVIPNGFDCSVFHPMPEARLSVCEELGLSPNCPLIGLIARWQPLKNHRGFFAAAAMLVRQYPDANFLCIGRGCSADNPEVLACVPEEIRHQVHLLAERGDIPRLTAALDIAVNASHAEAFPNVVGEAMACGIPMVVTDVGDSAWILDGCGRVVMPRDDFALSDAMAALLALPQHERKQLGHQACNRIVEHFSLAAVADHYFQEWSSLLRRPD